MQIIYGINPVSEILRSEGGNIRKIILAEGRKGEDVKKILSLASSRGIAVEVHFLGRLAVEIVGGSDQLVPDLR